MYNCKVHSSSTSLAEVQRHFMPPLPPSNVPCPPHPLGTVSGRHYHSCPGSRSRCRRSLHCSLRRGRPAPPASAWPSPSQLHVFSATWCAGSGTRPANSERDRAKKVMDEYSLLLQCSSYSSGAIKKFLNISLLLLNPSALFLFFWVLFNLIDDICLSE